MKFAILTSQFNSEVTSGLKKGAHAYLAEKGVASDSIQEFSAPGAFEIPLIAQKLAKCGKFAGVICLGCVIKGDTAHFEFISLGATLGIMQSMLSTETPISFGILTTYTEEQAESRSRENPENKGREAAAACFETVVALKEIRNLG
ncbi:MAG: 6,7-dimethyl-8-ribityllumazine synthase [Cryobacterium sp.]|nr:6,7-dimethyl-8-ribityllumazine synthase [Oligoflexia bacterium]